MSITIDGVSYPNANVTISTNGAGTGLPPLPGAPGPTPAPQPGPSVPPVTVGDIVYVVYPWASPVRVPITFNVNEEVVIEFTTGNGSSVTGNLPFIRAAEAEGSFAEMVAAVSDQPNSYTPLSFASSGASVSFRVDNAVEPDPNFPGMYANLQRNTKYYFNLKNAPGNGVTGPRRIFVDLQKNGTP